MIPIYPPEEIARRAKEIYARIKDQVDPGNTGKILAIDVESGEYVVDTTSIAASDQLNARFENPQIFCFRIGYQTATWFGGQCRRIAS